MPWPGLAADIDVCRHFSIAGVLDGFVVAAGLHAKPNHRLQCGPSLWKITLPSLSGGLGSPPELRHGFCH